MGLVGSGGNEVVGTVVVWSWVDCCPRFYEGFRKQLEGGRERARERERVSFSLFLSCSERAFLRRHSCLMDSLLVCF